MKCTLQDSFQIENSLVGINIQPLMRGYLPLIGYEALGLYLYLATEKQNNSVLSLSHLEQALSLNITQLTSALEALLKVELLDLYVQKRDTHQHLLCKLNGALHLNEFMHHDVLGRALLKAVGEKQFEALRQSLQSSLSLMGYDAYPRDKNQAYVSSWSTHEETVFQSKIATVSKVENLSFDLKAFLRECSPLIFPLKKRTEAALRIIQEIGSVYGVSPSRMSELVGKVYVEDELELNGEKLRKLAAKEIIEEVKEGTSLYDVPPSLFLKRLRKGIEATSLEKYLLVKLVSKDGLIPEVLNVLLEHHFNQYKGKINTKVLEETALQWAVMNIRTVDEANQLKMTPTSASRSRRIEPALEKAPESLELSETEKAAIRSAFKNLK